ncbi:signal recognition particle-docking protein FtsY [Methanofollis aquaemaris]|uniref:Signal recognition particle receptor FtsY n=1 Tax=Methanofollis aquaemaris TaxID=126734 RepID=A0A8A3S531_9EURY|nr:signal recognition particle-docking protein FtsY [Methanofollis aquaemaris]QSZ66736.1 signal recognition particle-docking protein FtsY [Methanofollis aquaemaris]
MFEGLKNKLQNIKEKFGHSIQDAAGEAVREEVRPEIPAPAPAEVGEPVFEPEKPAVEPLPEPLAPAPEPAPRAPAPAAPEVRPAEERKRFGGLVSRVKTLVLERELVISEKDIEEPLFELEMVLLENDVALEVTDAIIGYMREDLVGSHRKIGTSVDEIVMSALRGALLKVLGEGLDLLEYIKAHDRPVKILITGVNGTGKTTSIAKIAHYLKANGHSVVIGAGDTFRAGAIDQIAEHGRRLDIKVIKHQEGSDPAAVLYDSVEYARGHGIDVVLADTAGRFHNRKNLMNQLEKIRRVMKPDLVVYVDEAVAGNDAVVRAKDFNDLVGTDAVMLTKADMDSRGGAAISIAQTIGKPILFLGTGQAYSDIVPFRPEAVVGELLGAEE